MTSRRGSKKGGALNLLLIALVLGGAVPCLSHPQSDRGGGRPRETETNERERERNPAFNVWEYAFINDKSALRPPSSSSASPPGIQNDVPAASPGLGQRGGGQSPCMWAIVNCCHGSSNSRSFERQYCFETNRCGGAWFQDLCSQEFIDIAHRHVLGFFGNAFNK